MRSTLDPPAKPAEENLTAEQQEWLALVKRIAASEVLSRASQLRDILLYIVDRSLHDTYPIKERDIACEVLKRPPNFDGTLDNIVRVQVGHLRRKLDQYFATDGKDEQLLIVIPRGSYIPKFEFREKPKEIALEPEPLSGVVQPVVPASQASVSRSLWMSAVAILLVVVIGASILMSRSRTANSNVAAGQITPRSANFIMQRMFGSANTVSVVAADTNVLLIGAILHRDVSISEYSAPNYPDNLMTADTTPQMRELIHLIAIRRYTSFGDTAVMVLTSKEAAQFGKEIAPRYSRLINMQDLQRGNFIFIGKSPWLNLFDPKLNFVQYEDPVTHAHSVLNRNPEAGEPRFYPVIGNWSTESTSYALISLLPNPAHTGSVLVLDGTGMEATEAAMEFLSSPESKDKIDRILKGRELDEQAPLEILLRVYSVQGIAHDFEIASVRSKAK